MFLILRKPRSGCLEERTAIAFVQAAPYIFCVGQPTMAINGVRNKRCGPGGGTRRLHQFPPATSANQSANRPAIFGGELGSTRVVKVRTVARHDTTVIGS